MGHDAEKKHGRSMLLALLGLNLLLDVLSDVVYYSAWGGFSPLLLLLLAVGLLPSLVILWGVLRGSYPAVAVLCITAVMGVGNLVGILQFGGMAALGRETALSMVSLLAQVTLLLAVFRHDAVNGYWLWRRGRRKRRDLVLEIVLFAAAVLLQFVPGLVFYGVFSIV